MEATNTVDHERHGVRTFSAKEIAFNNLGLMRPLLFSFSITQVEPVRADLNGGMDRLPDLPDITTRISRRRTTGVEALRVLQTLNVTARANFQFSFLNLEPAESLEDLTKLRVGWRMMCFIKHFDGRLKDGSLYVRWVNAKSGEPVDDAGMRRRISPTLAFVLSENELLHDLSSTYRVSGNGPEARFSRGVSDARTGRSPAIISYTMPVPIPQIHYKVLAPFLKNIASGLPCPKWKSFISTATHLKMDVQKISGGRWKFTPPPPGTTPAWTKRCTPLILPGPKTVHMSHNQTLTARKKMRNEWEWDEHTFVTE
ncbi:hypothetical protein L227DRAFT_605650 [Lentinus tigrinus ALCF2SS1-6]|uniref:Uncharacterized protein n=1 Tax=Lentinus tigrinus ALCF2SS1-6 TaxID=1328759 RepID=A0A5C2SUD2_9APHY|nr:hypothetical protein L227DRAFT_605650 [Lentinus tigrinus ALCF2SS1-6]